MSTTPGLAQRLELVRGGIADAARDASRAPGDITTIVVTKFHPAELVDALYRLGVRDFGESRHQEAQPKIEALGLSDATWHFIGQVQSKKAKQIAQYADVIHSLDRESLIPLLGAERVFIQVNLTDDPQRGGVAPDGVDALAEQALAGGLNLLGLMAVAPLSQEPRRAFAAVRAMSERLRSVAPTASALSIGMSGDYRDAILEGATHLRIGTAITGNRPTPG